MKKVIDGIKLFFMVIGYGIALAGIGFLRGLVMLIVGGIIVAVVVVIGFLIAFPLSILLFYLSR